MSEFRLNVRDHTGRISSASIDRFPFTLGRGLENDLVLAEPSVSSKHALFLYTDGLVEVENKPGEPFGASRLKETFVERRHDDLVAIRWHILKALDSFSVVQSPSDDRTLVPVCRE